MRINLGKSVAGREVYAYGNFPPQAAHASLHSSQPLTLLIGGTHGDERATVPILENFIRAYLESGKVTAPTAVIPLLNPDGYAANTRCNARGVDLNRNFPHNWRAASDEPAGPHPLSEPEARYLHDFVNAHRPAKIVSLHWALAEIDADGPQSAGLAMRMWDALDDDQKKPYRLRFHQEAGRDAATHQGFCSGSLGQWCGHGLSYPDRTRPAMVTLELPHHPHFHPRPDVLPEDHFESVGEYWNASPGEYLAGVQGPAHRLLEAACGFVPGRGNGDG